MVGRSNEECVLAGLAPAFRREVEISAANIMARIGPATPERLQSLAVLAAGEALAAHPPHKAETALALAAELKRRALAMSY